MVVRGTGKRSLSELTPLDLLLVVIVGDLVQQGVTQQDMSVTGAVLAVSVFVLWTFVAEALERRSRSVRRVISGELKEAARFVGYGDLGEIAYAVLETDGKLSFIPTPAR